MATFGGILSSLTMTAGKYLRRKADDSAFEVASPDYVLQGFGVQQATPADATTYYWGWSTNVAPTTTANTSTISIPITGTIIAAQVTAACPVTAGSNEAWVMNLFTNNTTTTQIASITSTAALRVWLNTSLSLAVTAGDTLEIKEVTPTWATDPVNIRRTVWVLIRPTS